MNIPKLTHECSVVMASWNNYELLRRCIPVLKRNAKLDTRLFVALNDGDKASADYLRDEQIAFTSVPYNAGTQIVDVLQPFCKSLITIWMNDDMYLSPGYDLDLKSIIDESYPTAAQVRGVERRNTTDSIVIGDPTLPEWMADEAYPEFERRALAGQYTCGQHYGLFHPIAALTEDVKLVGGFGADLDMSFFPGHSADSYFAKALYDLDNEYRFVISGTSFDYHYSSYSNRRLKQIDPAADARHNSEEFNSRAGMTQKEFHQLIRYGQPV